MVDFYNFGMVARDIASVRQDLAASSGLTGRDKKGQTVTELLTTCFRRGLASMVRTLLVPSLVACIACSRRRRLLARNAMARHANPGTEPRLVLPLVPLF